MAESTRRRVTYSQLEMLWEFLRKNKEIAMGYNKTSQARTYSRRMWEQVAHSLNSHGDGAEKNWKGWCKYWNDYKSKIKKLAVAQKASNKKTGGGPCNTKPLTEIENKFIDLMGTDFGCGLPGVRVEPFEEEFSQRHTEECGSELVQRAHSQSLLLGMDTISIPIICQPEPSWRVDALTPHASPPMPSTPPPFPSTPPPLYSAPPLPLPSTPILEAESSIHTPRLSPRRRRRNRRQPTMSAMAARREIIQISQQRIEVEEKRNTLLEGMLGQLIEIKQILQTRWNDNSTIAERVEL